MKWRQYLSSSPLVTGVKERYFEDTEDIVLKADSKTTSSPTDSLPPVSVSPTSYSKSSELPPRTAKNEGACPLQVGWIIAYRDRFGILRGGYDDAERATVVECQFDGLAWMVRLSGGEEIDLRTIRSVAKTDNTGAVVAAWTVREHGYDGLK